jgi:hypothetical protein
VEEETQSTEITLASPVESPVEDTVSILAVPHVEPSAVVVEEEPESLIYSSVEEIKLTGGMLYAAVKPGSTLQVTDFVTTIQILVSPSDSTSERDTDIYTFGKTYEEAVTYWSGQSQSEYIDVEVEKTEFSEDGLAPNPPSMRNLPGFKKPKQVGNASESQLILRSLEKKKEKNRSRNKASKKSRAKNRK